jgi:hypothetical protein
VTRPEWVSATPLQSLESVRQRVISLRGSYGSWERVAALWGVSVGTLVRVAGGYEPKRAGIRAALGLPPLGIVHMSPGIAVSFGAILMVSSSICPCGRSFIPNHPSRTHCPTCRPPRKGHRRTHNI